MLKNNRYYMLKAEKREKQRKKKRYGIVDKKSPLREILNLKMSLSKEDKAKIKAKVMKKIKI